MKKIGITQRVVHVAAYGERRDCLDQAWAELVVNLGAYPVPLSNNVLDTPSYLAALDLDGIVLSSGNDPASLSGASEPAPERDRFEAATIEFCLDRDVPLFGVCRGLQFINLHFGGSLERVEGHVAAPHEIVEGVNRRMVNSFHNWGIPSSGLAKPLVANATDAEGNVEAACLPGKRLAAVMWHPEREDPVNPEDCRSLLSFFRPMSSDKLL